MIPRAVMKWLNLLRVKTLFIEPGRTWENGHIESFNGKSYEMNCWTRKSLLPLKRREY